MRLHQEFSRSRRYRTPLSIVLMDIVQSGADLNVTASSLTLVSGGSIGDVDDAGVQLPAPDPIEVQVTSLTLTTGGRPLW